MLHREIFFLLKNVVGVRFCQQRYNTLERDKIIVNGIVIKVWSFWAQSNRIFFIILLCKQLQTSLPSIIFRQTVCLAKVGDFKWTAIPFGRPTDWYQIRSPSQTLRTCSYPSYLENISILSTLPVFSKYLQLGSFHSLIPSSKPWTLPSCPKLWLGFLSRSYLCSGLPCNCLIKVKTHSVLYRFLFQCSYSWLLALRLLSDIFLKKRKRI